MSLGIKIINTYHLDQQYSQVYLLDDTLMQIKEKLFNELDDFSMYPNFLKLQIKENEQFITINDNNCILFSYTSLPTEPVIYITNIIDLLSDKSKYDITELYMLSTKDNSTDFTEIYNKLLTDFINLTEDDLLFIIKLILFDINNETYSFLQNDINEYASKIENEQITIKKIYTPLNKSFSNFYKYAYEIKDFSSFFDSDLIISNIFLKITGSQYETGIKGRFIKLENLFNTLELSDTIPFIAIQLDKKNEPLIKIHNNLLQIISDKEVKNWILNEKKKLNILSYKRIQGLYLKYRLYNFPKITFLTINILNNGKIYTRLEIDQEDTSPISLSKIIDIIFKSVDNIVEILNTLKDSFLFSKKLEPIKNSTYIIDSINASVSTNQRIERSRFSALVNKQFISENLFELKDLSSEIITSLYYKKFGHKKEDDYSLDERKGITINIKDNPYKLGSSVISILSAFNYNQLDIISKNIIITNLLIDIEKSTILLIEDPTQKTKKKSTIKQLKQEGIETGSTSCQLPRQPILGETALPEFPSYVLEYKGKKFICPNPKFPYPGFTSSDIMCCFAKDQRNNPKYIRNIKPASEIIVQPSNFIISATIPGKGLFNTRIVKVLSDFSLDTLSLYHFLSDNNNLLPITNVNLITEIQQYETDAELLNKNFWLEPVPISTIQSQPPKNICSTAPLMNISVSHSLNERCNSYQYNKSFGYTSDSYPCCFANNPLFSEKKIPTKLDIYKEHIIQSDKILDNQRVGVLFKGIDILFNQLIENKSKSDIGYYRLGTHQNKLAFINSILTTLDYTINNKIINTAYEFKKELVSYLTKYPDLFAQLNKGSISIKYKSLNNYIKLIENPNNILSPSDIIDLVQRFIGYNLIIIDIPVDQSASKTTTLANESRIMCNMASYNYSNKFIILLKRRNVFESIIYIGTSKHNLLTTFDYNSNVIQFLINYYNSSCVYENSYPESFTFTPLYDISDALTIFNDTSFPILAQVVNKFNKVEYLLLKNAYLFPIKETGIIGDFKTISFEQFLSSKHLLNISQFIQYTKDINSILLQKKYNLIKLFGISFSGLDEEPSGIYTHFGQFIPIKTTSDIYTTYNTLIIDIPYYPYINYFISQENLESNEQVNYSNTIKQLKHNTYELKTFLGNTINNSEKIKQHIVSFNNSINTKSVKVIYISELLYKILEKTSTQHSFIKTYSNDLLQLLLKYISSEIVNDNKENLLLNGVITSDFFNPNEIIKRDSESILLDINDITKWLKTMKN